jgi:hypothetical protein
MSEQSARHTFKKHVDRLGAHWQRFEDSLSVGIPDINICYKGKEVWIEAKQFDESKLPKRERTPVRIGLSAEQCLWLTQRRMAGGHVAVLLKLGRTWYLFRRNFEALRDGMILEDLKIHAAWSSEVMDAEAVLGII